MMRIEVDDHVSLKLLELSDARDIFSAIDKQREYLGRWLPFVEFTKGLEDTEGFVESVLNVPGSRFEYVYSIRRGDTFVGLIGYKDTDRQNRKTEIGYWLSEEFQGQGIVSRSVIELCRFAFDKMDMNRIQIKCAVGNMPSKRVPLRLGFKLEGVERAGELLTGNVFTDLEVYSMLKSEFAVKYMR